jgi:hypothetical protein
MRDVERLREKIEISLEGRQAWALGISALLLLAGVFVVGVMVGRRSAPAAAAASGDLAALDEAAEQAKPAPAIVPSKPKPAAPSPVAPPPVGEKLADKPAAVAEPAPKPAVEQPTSAPTVALAEVEKPAEKVAEKHDAQGRTPAHAATPVSIPPRPVTAVPPPKPPAKDLALTAAPRDLGPFTVQIGASQERVEAARMEQKARAAGLKPYSVEADLGVRGTWYRVRVGSFADREKASSYRRDVERELRTPAVVMNTR